jgi:hypothetical protein
MWSLWFVWSVWLFWLNFRPGQPDKQNKPDKPARQPSALFPHLIVGQTTQNPELITQNFPKRRGDFTQGKGYSASAIVEWKPSLAWVFSDGTSREVCDLRMNI